MKSEVNSEEKLSSANAIYNISLKSEEFIEEACLLYPSFIEHLVYLIELKDFEVSKAALKIACVMCSIDKYADVLASHSFLTFLETPKRQYEFCALYNIS